ncbi:response regulator transcription factor [Niveibacterium sp. 24ML]|uniref:helix-turn-helix transcriptional regulator n=1 Tax=Niveibacterium sp. 24ML TaxID=2985512 RepID=UPI002270B7AD|nr:helix-turn-helix transcriptional regulator [Niveibacterium sp. 24ML]MCX9155302.1 response regulator transcription factor [Niveibacterium sp. 24ML]
MTVLAPGGFGKTCALRGFWSDWPQTRAWIDCATALLPGALELAGSEIGDGGLLLIDSAERLDTLAAQALAATIEALPRSARVIIAGRHANHLPIALWRSQGRLSALSAHHLALSQDEWRAAGLGGTAESWAGWWGACQAALHPDAPWDEELARWLEQAWLDALDDTQLADLGRSALLPESRPEWLMALGVGARAQADATLLSVATLAGPLCNAGGGVMLAARYRPYLVAAWRKRDPHAWRSALDAGTTALLARGEHRPAALLALDAGDTALCLSVIEQAGWRLLFDRNRPLLRTLLDATATETHHTARNLLEAAWKVEVTKLPHEADAQIAQLCEHEDAAIAAQARALAASISYQYDGFECAMAHATKALEALQEDLHPAFALAQHIAAGCAFAMGDFADAQSRLTYMLACADRDRLDWLQFEALHRRASLALESGDLDTALRWSIERRKRIRTSGLESATALDPSLRLEAMIQLRRLDAGAARRLLPAGTEAACTYGAYWSFTYGTLQTIASLVEGDNDAASDGVAWLESQLAERFLCVKWRAEALLPRIWARAREARHDALLELAARALAEPWPPSIYRDRRDLLCAAARLLAGESADAAAVLAIVERLEGGGAKDLAILGRRILALDSGDSGLLLEAVRIASAHNDRLDWLWLAPRALGPLESLLTEPSLAGDSLTRNFLRELVQRMLERRRAPSSEDAADSTESAEPPPAGLTAKEWEILQLIGEQFTNEQIANRLYVSLATVKTHINHIYSKLGIRSRSEAVHRARTL